VLDLSLRVLHVVAVVAYVGGGLLLHGPLRRALRLIPPGQASIVGSRVGGDFTYLSWMSVALLGSTGYWMALRYGWGDVSSPLTLLINPRVLQTSRGVAMLVMVSAWYLILIGAAIITLVLRPRLGLRVTPDATVEAADRAVVTISRAARWIDVLALANLGLATLGMLAGAFFH